MAERLGGPSERIRNDGNGHDGNGHSVATRVDLVAAALVATVLCAASCASPPPALPERGDVAADASADTQDASSLDAVDVGVGRNPCGGSAYLDMSTPLGGSCGVCADGRLACDGPNVLRCVGGTAPNACGGCGLLPGESGDVCGPCGGGRLECDDRGRMRCVEAAPNNACGGCAEFDMAPGDACEGGEWACSAADPDLLVCESGTDLNPCGGLAGLSYRDGLRPELDALLPGAPCGWAGGGALRCTTRATVECFEHPLNTCGGWAALPVEPGRSGCGPCDQGLWICDPTEPESARDLERVFCSSASTVINACGGCNPIGAALGAECPGGFIQCSGDEATCLAP